MSEELMEEKLIEHQKVCEEKYIHTKPFIKTAVGLAGIIITLIIMSVTYAMNTSNRITATEADTKYLKADMAEVKAKYDNIDKKLDIILKRTEK